MQSVVAVFSAAGHLDVAAAEHELRAATAYPDLAAVRSESWVSAAATCLIVAASTDGAVAGGLLSRGGSGGVVAATVGDPAGPVDLTTSADLGRRLAATAGAFAAVVAEEDGTVLTAATAPSGRVPLYLAEAADRVVVSSWASVAARLAGSDPRPTDPVAIASLVNNGFVASRRTVFEGVSSLAAGSTVRAHMASVERIDGLRSILRGQVGLTPEAVDRLTEAYVDALRPLRDAGEPVRLALSGGKDSRLVLAGLLAAGIEVRAATSDAGPANRADARVARQVAARAGIPHEVRGPGSGGPTGEGGGPDPYRQTARVLRVSEGMLHGFKPVPVPRQVPPGPIHLTGGGGEVLRGGHARGFLHPRVRPPRALVRRELVRRHLKFEAVLRDDAAEELRSVLGAELAEMAEGLDGPQLLDRAYVDYRNANWLSLVLRGDSTNRRSLIPATDNVVVATALGIDPAARSTERVVHEMMRRLAPDLADIPFADDEWAFRRSAGRVVQRVGGKRLKAASGRATKDSGPEQPRPGTAAGPRRPWPLRFHRPPLRDELRERILGACDSSILGCVVDPGKVGSLLDSDEWRPPTYLQLAWNLYSAAVLATDPSVLRPD